MSANAYLDLTIHPNGSISAETHQIHGSACLHYIALLEDLLEAETISSSYTDDYTTTGVTDPTVSTAPTSQLNLGLDHH